MKTRYMEVAETIEEGLDILKEVGCEVTDEIRNEFVTKSVYKYRDTIVFHDPYGILNT